MFRANLCEFHRGVFDSIRVLTEAGIIPNCNSCHRRLNSEFKFEICDGHLSMFDSSPEQFADDNALVLESDCGCIYEEELFNSELNFMNYV